MLRLLCLNQSTGSESQVLGHAAVERSLRIGLAGELDATFVRMARWRRGARWVAQPIPRLVELGLDLSPVRWHLVEALRGYAAVSRLTGRAEYDALHVTSHSLAFGLASVMRRVPTLLTVDVAALDWARMGIWTKSRDYTAATLAPALLVERLTFLNASVNLAMTDWSRDSILRAAPGANVLVHHPGIDADAFRPAPARHEGPLRVLFVGGRFAQKGGHDLLEALAPELGQTLELNIVTQTDVPAREGVRSHRLRPDDPMMIELFRQADLFCLPSYGDAVPWVVLEAMACGVPVVGSTVGGIPSMLGSAGALVAPGDIGALRSTIFALLDDPTRRRAMGAAGRAAVEDRYDARKQGRTLAGIVEVAVQERRSKMSVAVPGA